MVIDVVGRGRPLDRPVEQLRVVDDRAVERRDRTGRMLAVDNEILRRRRIGPDVGVVDDERGQEHTKPHDEAEALVDKRGLKVRIGQFSGDGGALVFHELTG